MTEIDRIDRKILKFLQDDGRIATVDLAEKVGLSPTSTSERMNSWSTAASTALTRRT